MILTRTPEEAAAAWDSGQVRSPYLSRAALVAWCMTVQADCARLGRSVYGSSAKVEELSQ